MNDTQKILEIVRLQSELLLKNASRLMMLQAALESHIHDHVGDAGPDRDSHFQLRQQLFDADDKSSKDLLNRLHRAIQNV